MKLIIGNDHAGIELKKEIVAHLHEQGYIVNDVGVDTGERSDYPVIAKKVAAAISDHEYNLGILICGTGIGISLAANKVPGIRCALCTDPLMARLTREHNDANMLALGARVLGEGLALKIVDTFLDTPFEGGRHARRIEKLMAIEERN